MEIITVCATGLCFGSFEYRVDSCTAQRPGRLSSCSEHLKMWLNMSFSVSSSSQLSAVQRGHETILAHCVLDGYWELWILAVVLPSCFIARDRQIGFKKNLHYSSSGPFILQQWVKLRNRPVITSSHLQNMAVSDNLNVSWWNPAHNWMSTPPTGIKQSVRVEFRAGRSNNI